MPTIYNHFIAVLFGCILSTNACAKGQTTLIDVSSFGDASYGGSISANGRYVALMFDYVGGDLNTYSDVLIYDQIANKATRIAANYNHSALPAPAVNLSADGNVVTFYSDAANLVPGDTNNVSDIFVHDRRTRKTSRVSINSNGTQGDGNSRNPSISADGRFVAFESYAFNLTAVGVHDIYLHDRLTQKTTQISVTPGGVPTDNFSSSPSINADGRFVAFESAAGNLITGDTNHNEDIFVRDRLKQQTIRASVNSAGVQGNQRSLNPSISANGRFVAFDSEAFNLVAGDNNGVKDVFVRDLLTKQTARVSVDSSGAQGNDSSSDPVISADGRYVVFNSRAANLVANDTNNASDVFVHDRLTGNTSRANVSTDGTQAEFTFSGSHKHSLSAGGRFVAFNSSASNLVSGGSIWPNTYLRDRSLNTAVQSNLAIAITQKPLALAVNSTGVFVYTITNNGPETAGNVRIVWVLANGQLLNVIADTGFCKQYSAIKICDLGTLPSGVSKTITAEIKALRNPLTQQLSISAGSNADPKPGNNFITVATPMIP